MSTATVNGADAVKGSSTTGGAAPKQQQQQQQQQQFKTGAGGKTLDGARKQAASPVDGQNRKQTSQTPRAWQGPNPITQRASNQPNMANGNEKPLPKLPTSSQPKTNGASHTGKHAHDRLLFLLAHFTGKDVTLTLKDGEQFTGVFSGSSVEPPSRATYLLKMVKRTRLPSHRQTNGSTELAGEYIGEGEDHIMVFDVQDTAALDCLDVSTASAHVTQNGSAASSFRTDTEISGREPHMPRQRELQRWDAGADSSMDGLSLEDSGDKSWDQFAANERTFGVQSSYDEDIYTTSIDRSHPLYRQRAAEAERLAREIEGSTSTNAHVTEERRRDADRDDGLDEEEKYSGVGRDITPLLRGSTGSYVPPARRPISNLPTVQGAPYDPAIISSQLAKPASTQPVQSSQPAPPPAPQDLAEPPVDAAIPEPIPTVEVQQPTATADSSKNGVETAPTVSVPKKTENTTEDHVRGTADAFKLFANNEKLRLRQAQEAKKSSQRAEKNVKLNDLKRFAENFKLKSRVPDDLVPILAKDREKQMEIQRKAEESAREEEVKAKDKTKLPVVSPAASAASQATASYEARPLLPQVHSRGRTSQNSRNPPTLPGNNATVSPRAPQSQRQPQFFNQRPPVQQLPENIRIPTGPATAMQSSETTPLSPTKFNVNAKSFEFRPAAHNFTPIGTSPSPQRLPSSLPAEETTPSFFNEKEKMVAQEQKILNSAANATNHLTNVEYTEEQKKGFATNNGVPQPFRTPPTWTVSDERINSSFLDTFPKNQLTSQVPSPLHTPNPAGGPMPHAHQLPHHLQASHMSTPPQQQRFYPQQQQQQHGGQHGHGQNYDPRMQFQGPNGSVQNSPRFPPAQMAGYNGQMGQMPQLAQMPQFAGQPMQAYGMSPSMGYRQVQMPSGGPMMMMPGGQSHGQMNMRQAYHPGPQYGAPNMPQMGGQMMSQQPSSGGYMPSPMPQHAYPPMGPHGQSHMQQQHAGPQHPGAAGGPGGNGYAASPRAGPPMMQHTNSQQGFHPQQGGGGMPQHMQSPYGGGGGGAPHPYHMQQRQLSTGGHYPQMTPRQQQAMPAGVQHVPSPGMGGPPGQAQGDEGK